MPDVKPLPIHERFYSWQGEGVHLGRPAFFIRTFGCPVKCPWCDSAGTWHPDYTPERIEKCAPRELAGEAAKTACAFVVITGGEPAMHDLQPLTAALAEVGLKTHLETSGGFPLRGEFSWITVSPKWGQMPLPENIRRADEIKLIVEEETSLERWMERIGDWIQTEHVWLYPEWSQRENPKILRSISKAVKNRGNPFRAGFQVHKLFHVDLEDKNSRPPAPLGGDPRKGY